MQRKLSAKTVRNRLYNLHQAEVAETQRYDRKMAALAGARRALQFRCPHTKTRYIPDVAGGSDSWTECVICGVDMSRVPKE